MANEYWKNDYSKGYTEISRLGYYNTSAWKKLRLLKLGNNPLCEMCLAVNRLTPAKVVDHIEPITKENIELFYEYSNLQSLCDEHHRVKTLADRGIKAVTKSDKIANGKILKQELEDWND